MSVELRLPYITGGTEREQLQQLKSYLYQLTEQLQIALNANDPTSVTQQVVIQSTNAPSSSAPQPFDAEVTFAALKPLIIKSAEIVEAYYEEINKKLEGIYVAESDFGTFVEKTEQKIKETSEYTERGFSNVQTIIDEKVGAAKSELEGEQAKTNEELGKAKDEVKGLSRYVVETKAYIKTGKVDEEIRDGIPIPIYGIQIGQEDTINNNKFKRFARFTADKLSFYDENDYEVAYISKSKLFINHAEIKNSYKIGGFKDEVNQTTGDVVTKWEGWG